MLSDFRNMWGKKRISYFLSCYVQEQHVFNRIRLILAVSSYALANSLDFCCLTFIIFINVRVKNAAFSRLSRSRDQEVLWSERSSRAAPERRGVPTKPLLQINVNLLPQQQLICEPADGQTGRRLLGSAGSHLSHHRPL